MNAVAEIKEQPLSQGDFTTPAIMFDFGMIEKMQKLAEVMSTSVVAVPKHFQSKPGDCLAVVMQAAQWGMNPFAVAQKTHLVNGQLGYEAQLVNAVVQASGSITGRFHYEYQGEGQGLECRVGAVIKGEKNLTWNEWLCVSDVIVKNSPLWKSNPRQQLGYLQVKNWARQFVPGAILGVYTPDEIEDAPPKEINMGSAEVVKTTRADQIKSKLSGASSQAATAQAAEVLPSVDEVVAKVMAAEDINQLNAAIEHVSSLPDAELDAVRQAFARRKKELKAVAEQGVQQSYQFTREEVLNALTSAKDMDTLGIAADMIQGVAPEYREELAGIYNQRRDELENN